MILCTGSQGEPLSALTRIAYDDHQSISIEPGDTVIMSAKPVPGNELAVHDTMNQLWRAGATVLRQETAPVHVSGHGAAEELKTVLGLVRPRHVIPVHGEMRHLHAHAGLARSLGVPADRVFIPELGDCFELEAGEVRRAGKVDAGVAFVDGLGIGAIQDVVLRDRRQLSADGTLVIVCQLHEDGNGAGRAEVIARGFAPEGAEEAETLLADVQACAAETLAALPASARRRSCRPTCTTPSPSSSTAGPASARSSSRSSWRSDMSKHKHKRAHAHGRSHGIPLAKRIRRFRAKRRTMRLSK